MSDKVKSEALVKQLNSLKNLKYKLATKHGAELILERAQELAPVRTGNLRDSGEVQEHGEGYAVAFMADYAIPVEFGTSKMQAQPFLRPAIDEYESKVVKVLAEDIEVEIKKNV